MYRNRPSAQDTLYEPTDARYRNRPSALDALYGRANSQVYRKGTSQPARLRTQGLYDGHFI